MHADLVPNDTGRHRMHCTNVNEFHFSAANCQKHNERKQSSEFPQTTIFHDDVSKDPILRFPTVAIH